MKQYFTFGLGHPLGKFYVELEGEDAGDCRREMNSLFGNVWAFQYDSDEKFASFSPPLTKLPLKPNPYSGILQIDPADFKEVVLNV